MIFAIFPFKAGLDLWSPHLEESEEPVSATFCSGGTPKDRARLSDKPVWKVGEMDQACDQIMIIRKDDEARAWLPGRQ